MSKKKKNQPSSTQVVTRQANPIPANQNAGTSVNHVSFQGPLPPPGMLRQYDEVAPGTAERIIAMAESEQRHRHKEDVRINSANVVLSRVNAAEMLLGQIFAFIIAMGGLWTGKELIVGGHVLAGSIFSGAVLVALVAVFIKGRSQAGK